MKTHIEYLQEWLPDLLSRRILDVGAGRGSVLIDIAKKGGRAQGVEPFAKYISIAKERATSAGVSIDIIQGHGENLPFREESFGFVNLTEVIEHVNDPEKVLREVYRVLEPDGVVYMSVPNRYGFEDHHFHLYFVNWLPRFLAPLFITVFGKHKDYSNPDIGLQRLDEMNYYTFGGIERLSKAVGYDVRDIRVDKIHRLYANRSFMRSLILAVYYVARTFYFESFHLELIKGNGQIL